MAFISERFIAAERLHQDFRLPLCQLALDGLPIPSCAQRILDLLNLVENVAEPLVEIIHLQDS